MSKQRLFIHLFFLDSKFQNKLVYLSLRENGEIVTASAFCTESLRYLNENPIDGNFFFFCLAIQWHISIDRKCVKSQTLPWALFVVVVSFLLKKLSLAQYILTFFKLTNGAYPSGTFLSKIWKSHIGLLDVMFDIDLKQAGVTAAVFVRYITFYSSMTGFRLYFALFKVQRLKELPTYLNILGQHSFLRDAPPVDEMFRGILIGQMV